jgi:hypothetical protein
LLKVLCIIDFTRVVWTFCHFRLFRPKLYSTESQLSRILLRSYEEETILICATYKLCIRRYKIVYETTILYCLLLTVGCSWRQSYQWNLNFKSSIKTRNSQCDVTKVLLFQNLAT